MEKELNIWKKPLDVDYDEVPGSISIYFSRQSCFLMSEIVLKTSKSLATPVLPTHPHPHTHTHTPTYIYVTLYAHAAFVLAARCRFSFMLYCNIADEPHDNEQLPRPLTPAAPLCQHINSNSNSNNKMKRNRATNDDNDRKLSTIANRAVCG